MPDNPLVSVIIVNFNGKKYLKNCFDSLISGSYKKIELIFVDNGSTDGSAPFVKANYPQVAIIDNKANLGLAVASNIGAGAAAGKYLFFFNNDTLADFRLIENLVNAMEQDQSIGICGCETRTYDGKNIINKGVACDIFGYPYGKDEPFYVDAGIFIRNELFLSMAGFDEAMFLYGEDRDLCWRCWLYGYKVKVVEGAIFFHDSACITNDLKSYRTNINKRFWSEFNALRSILKNYSLLFILFILPLYMLINLGEIIIFLFKGRLEIINQVYLKSYWENLKSFRDLSIKRKKVQRERKISDFRLIKSMRKGIGKLDLFLSMGIPEFDKKAGYAK